MQDSFEMCFFFSLLIKKCWHGKMFFGLHVLDTHWAKQWPSLGKLCTRAEKVSPASRLPKYLFLASCYLLCLPPADTTWCQALSRRDRLPSTWTPGDWRDSSTLEGCWWTTLDQIPFWLLISAALPRPALAYWPLLVDMHLANKAFRASAVRILGAAAY